MVTRNLAPVIPIITTNEQSIQALPNDLDFGKSPLFDFRTREFILEGGNLCLIDGQANVEQWIALTLQVKQGIHSIYNNAFGSELLSLIGIGIDSNVIDTMLPNMIRSALLIDDRIINVSNFSSTITDDMIFLDFNVTLRTRDSFDLSQSWVVA